MSAVHEDISQAGSEARINGSLRAQVPRSTDVDPFWRQGTPLQGNTRMWEGPFITTGIVRKEVWVTVGKTLKAFPLSTVLLAATNARDDDYFDLLSIVVRDVEVRKSEINLVEGFLSTELRASLPKSMKAVKAELDGLI